jgi:molybdopterin converting factor small subunit
MATIWIPPLLRDLTGGLDQVTAAGATVRELVQALDARFPGIRARLCDGDLLRPGLAVFVDSCSAPLGLAQPVGPASEVHFLPQIAGGAPRTRTAWRA